MICTKTIGHYKCEGCSQPFCLQHANEHRQSLIQELEEIGVEHDVLQETIEQEQSRSKKLLLSIDQWEAESIEKIRANARISREKINQLAEQFQS